MAEHKTCVNCGKEIAQNPHTHQWFHWNSGKASCGLEAKPQ